VNRIAVLGVSGGRVPPGTEHLLAGADVVAGGRAVLDALAPDGARRVVLGAGLGGALAEIAGEPGSVCVLASGDPGFFGVVRALGQAVGRERLDVHPAPSSVALAFARLGLPWDDALVVSAHARDPRPAINAALRHPKVAILTQPGGAETIVAALAGREVIVAEALGTPDERLSSEPPFAEPTVVLALGPANGRATIWPPRTPTSWALPEAAFEHRAGMITKAEVRAVALAALGPGTGDLVWDVGCGSGSVAIECARLGAAAIAVDSDPEAIALTARNAAAHAVPVRVVQGAAPEALAGLPDPDATFVGGGGAALPLILDAAVPRTRRAVVVTLALVERIGPTLEQLTAHGLDATATTLQASRLRPLAGGHRLAAENPVTVITGRRP
jgi:precorrin-6Y C5,15-methyltransferase (decarboxylating)